MADLNYSIGIDTNQAQRSLAALRSSLAGFGSAVASAFAFKEIVQVTARFEDLRVTLETLYRDSNRGSAVFADIKDFAKTSAFAVEDLVQTIIKLKTAGIEPNIALLRLFGDVAGSVADRVGALQAITDLYARTTSGGLGIEELDRLGERGIPVYRILSEQLGITRQEVSKIGQTAEGANLILRALEVGLDQAFGGAASKKVGTLAQSMSNFRDTVNNLLDAFGRAGFNQSLANFLNALARELENTNGVFAKFGATIKITLDFLTENIRSVLVVLAALAAGFALTFGGFILRNAVGGIIVLAQGLGLLAKASVLLDNTIGKTKLGALLSLLIKLGAIGGAAFIGLKISDDISQSIDEFKKKYEELLKTTDKKPSAQGLPMGELAKNTGDFKNQVAALNTELNKFNAEMQNSVNAYALQTAEQLKSFTQQTSLIQASEEQRLAVETLANAQEGYLRAIAPLLDQYNQLSASGRKEDLEKLPAIQRALQGISKEYENSLPLLQEAINKRIQELQIVKELQVNAELLNKAYERRQEVDEAINDLMLRGPKMAKDATDSYINSTLDPLQRKLNEIAKEERDLRDATLKRIAAQFTSPDGEMVDSEGFARAVEEINRATERNIGLRQNQARVEGEYQRSFSAGWIKAYKDYRTAAEDASKRAASLFNKTVQGMEDLFVNFAKTGKFEWKRFISDLGEEILRSQLRQLFSGIFGDMTTAMQSGEGFMGAIGKLLGFGDSAGRGSQNNPMYVIDLATVKGAGAGSATGGSFLGNLFDQIKNIGSSIWDGITGIFGGGRGGGSSFLDSIVSGIGDFFGGFFANGGNLAAGKWGIAGERGPELITGPATVTPMLGTNVVYNISAVDAMSFKQMIASDPGFIHAVVQQGAKGVSRRY